MSMSSGQSSGSSRRRHSTSQHYVVPIGGAPFVRPFVMMQDGHDAAMCKEEAVAPAASAGSPTSSLASSSTSPASSNRSFFPSASPPMSESMSANGYEAAVRYSSAMLEHTQRMWQRERLTIERARLDGPAKTGTDTDKSKSRSPSSSPTASSSNQGEARRGSFASDALNVILRRRTIGSGSGRNGRRHRKTPSIV